MKKMPRVPCCCQHYYMGPLVFRRLGGRGRQRFRGGFGGDSCGGSSPNGLLTAAGAIPAPMFLTSAGCTGSLCAASVVSSLLLGGPALRRQIHGGRAGIAGVIGPPLGG